MRPDTAALGLPLVRATGTPAQIGRAYGEQARDAIAANVERYRARVRALQAPGLAEAQQLAAFGERFRAATMRRQPRIAAMLDGVAAGAACPRGDVYALNARTELLNAAGRAARGVAGAREDAAAQPAGDGGCTVVGLDGTRAAGGAAVLAQNWDWLPELADGTLVLATRDERGHAVVTLAEAGMLAKTGLNSAGIGACVNVLATARDHAGPPSPEALPYHVILRAVLESASFAEAVLVAAGTPRAASLNLLVGADGGELVDLELVPGDVAWTWPRDGALAHANHLEACASTSDLIAQLPPAEASSRGRGARARALLSHGGAATAPDLLEILRDHADQPICVHADPALPPEQRTETLAAVLLELGERRFSLAAGRPCERAPAALALAELFD